MHATPLSHASNLNAWPVQNNVPSDMVPGEFHSPSLLNCHVGAHLYETVASQYPSKRATPEVTGKKGSQTKTKSLNHIVQ